MAHGNVFAMKKPMLGFAAGAVLFPIVAALLLLMPRWFAVTSPNASLGLGLLALALGIASINTTIALATHEGYAIVVGDAGMEFPRAPLEGRTRKRVPWAQIGALFLNPAPPQSPYTLLVVHVDDLARIRPGKPIPARWIISNDALETGTVAEIARLAIELKSASAVIDRPIHPLDS